MADITTLLSPMLLLLASLPRQSDCQMLSASFAWSIDLDLPCDRYPGSCWQFTDILSVSHCEKICTDFTSPCLSYSYGWTSGLCTISNMSSNSLPAGYTDLVTSTNVSLFQRTRGEASELFEKWPYSSLPRLNSYKIILHNISLDLCAEECTRNSYFQCQSFGFSLLLKNCYLSDTRIDLEGGRLEYLAILDHYEYRHQVWPCNISLPYNYTRRVLATPNYPYTSLSDSACATTIWIPSGYNMLLNITWVKFDSDVCNTAEKGILVYTGDNPAELQLTDRICKQSLPETYVISNRKYLQIVAKPKVSSLQYQASFTFEPLQHLTAQNTSDLAYFNNYTWCLNDPCENGGVCQEIGNMSFCVCSAQFTGATCGEFVEVCGDNPCVNGQCVSNNVSYRCLCDAGYTGNHCETDLDECLSDVCPESDCHNTPGGYRCVCPHCQFGLCVYTGSAQGCQCFPGFTSKNCSEEVNECSDLTLCRHGECTDYVNGIKCICDDGFTGRRCDVEIIHPCDGDPCECGACVIIGDDFLCECPLTRSGKQCENFEELYNSILEPDDLTHQFCDVSTCEMKLRAKCEFTFLNYFHSIKTSFSNISIKSITIDKRTLIKTSFACNIVTGTLVVCEVMIAFIDSHSVLDVLLLNLTCGDRYCNDTSITVNSLAHVSSSSSETLLTCFPMLVDKIDAILVGTYISNSEKQFIPTHLVDIIYELSRSDDDILKNCAMNLIIQIKFLTCLDYPRLCDRSNVDTMVCVVDRRISGLSTISPTLSLSSTSTNAPGYSCSSMYCVNGYCPESEISPYCLCDAGFTGQLCDVRICNVVDGCNSTVNTCQNVTCFHGDCRLNAYIIPYCECHMGYTGIYCEIEMPHCDTSTCFHGNCSMDKHEFPQCKCNVGFTGKRCEYFLQNCDVKKCINGNCTTGDFGVSFCKCRDGYTGAQCQEIIPKCDIINCIHGNCSQDGSCQCYAGYDGIHCDRSLTDPRDRGSEQGAMFDYVLWSMVVVMAVLLVVTMTMVACLKVKRNRTRGEFSFNHLRRNDSGEVRPRLINARDIHADLRKVYYLSPTIEVGSQTSTSPPSFRTFHHDARETGSGVESVHTGSSDAYRRYSLPDDGCLSLHVSSDSNSSSQHYDIPPPPRSQIASSATDIHTVLRYAAPIHDDSESTSSSQTHYGDASQTIAGAAAGYSEA